MIVALQGPWKTMGLTRNVVLGGTYTAADLAEELQAALHASKNAYTYISINIYTQYYKNWKYNNNMEKE